MAVEKLNNTLVKNLPTKEKPYEVRDTDVAGLLVRVQPSGKKYFKLNYGRGKIFPIGDADSLTVTTARILAREKKVEAASGKDPIEEKRQKAVTTFSEFLDTKYQDKIKTTTKDPVKAIKRYHSICSRVGDWKLEFFTPLNMQKYINKRKDKGIANATINREIANIQTLLQCAYAWGFIKGHPFQGKVKKLKVTSEHPRYLSPEEESRLRKALEERDNRKREERRQGNRWRLERNYEPLPEIGLYCDHLTPLVMTAMLTGLRRGELFNLAWQDVDLRAKTIRVKASGAKSGKTRTVPLPAECLNVLTEWKQIAEYSQPGDYVFPNKEGKRLDNINTAYGNLLKTAKITGFRFHDLRHHYASILVQAGVQLYTVKELLGHSDFKMTQRYAHLAPDNLAEAVRALDNRRNREKENRGNQTGLAV